MLNHQLKPHTVARKISCFNTFSKYAQKVKWITSDFMMEIETPKMDSRLPNYMNMSDLNKLLHFLEMSKGRFALRNHLLILLIATTGMRRQEIVDFTWQQVDLDNSTIKVLGKGKKEQLLPLHPSLYELFQEYQDSMLEYKRYPEESVFRNKDRKN